MRHILANATHNWWLIWGKTLTSATNSAPYRQMQLGCFLASNQPPIVRHILANATHNRDVCVWSKRDVYEAKEMYMRQKRCICKSLLPCVCVCVCVCVKEGWLIWGKTLKSATNSAPYRQMQLGSFLASNQPPIMCCICGKRPAKMRHFKGLCHIVVAWGECALQHTATYCNTLQHTATHCNTPRPVIC